MYDSKSLWLGVDLTETTKKTSRKTPTRKRKIPVTINFIDKEFLERIKNLNDLNDAVEMERLFNLSKITKDASVSRRNSLTNSTMPSKPTSKYISSTKLHSTTRLTSKPTVSSIKIDSTTTKGSTLTKKSSAFNSIFISNNQVPFTLSSLTSTISMPFLNSTFLAPSTQPLTSSTTTTSQSSSSSITAINQTSLMFNQNQNLLSTFKEKLVQTTTSVLSSTVSNIDAHRNHNHNTGSTSRHDCNTNLTPIQFLNPNKANALNVSAEEYTNIWKMAFFVLAFLVGFISLLLILTFSIRILLTKLQRKSKFDYNDYNLQNMRPKSPHISSISLFEFDPDICSASNCGLTPIVNASRRSIGANTLKQNKNKHHSINSRATTITTAGFNSMFAQYCRHNQELLHANNHQQLYGISNKAFVEDLYDTTSNLGYTMNRTQVPSSFRPNNLNVNNNRKSADQLTKIEPNESVNDLKNNHERSKTIEIDMSSSSSARKDDQNGAYQSPWKASTTNDYEALEPNTATGSLANLSAVTTFSELLSESKNESYPFVKNKELVSTNFNENISRSSKITQELEMKLKERRQIMESNSDKFQPKILSPVDLCSVRNEQTNSAGNISNTTSSNNNQPISIVELDRKLKNWQNEIFNESVKTACKTPSNASNCVCPCHSKQGHEAGSEKHDHKCHSHHHQHQIKQQNQTSPSSNEKISHSRPESRTSETRPADRHHHHHHHRTETSASNKGKRPKIIIDGSSTLPTKRESIRMLIENKAVSENKQKNALEMHLNTLICSRTTNTCTINE